MTNLARIVWFFIIIIGCVGIVQEGRKAWAKRQLAAAQLVELQERVASLEVRLNKAKSATDEMSRLATEAGVLESEIASWRSRLPETLNSVEIIRDIVLMGSTAGVKLGSVEPALQEEVWGSLRGLRFGFGVEGRFAEMSKFIETLDKAARPTTIQEFKMTIKTTDKSGPMLSGSALINVYRWPASSPDGAP